jgi:hypothetical protein
MLFDLMVGSLIVSDCEKHHTLETPDVSKAYAGHVQPSHLSLSQEGVT